MVLTYLDRFDSLKFSFSATIPNIDTAIQGRSDRGGAGGCTPSLLLKILFFLNTKTEKVVLFQGRND